MNPTSLLGQLKLGHKFMILGLIAALLEIIPAFLYMSEAGKVLDAYEGEHEGLPIVVDGLKVVQYTQQHRGLSALVLGGVSTVAEKRRAKQAEADAAQHATALSDVDPLHAEHHVVLVRRRSD